MRSRSVSSVPTSETAVGLPLCAGSLARAGPAPARTRPGRSSRRPTETRPCRCRAPRSRCRRRRRAPAGADEHGSHPGRRATDAAALSIAGVRISRVTSLSVDGDERVGHLDLRAIARRSNRGFIVERHALREGFPRHRAIHRAAVDVPPEAAAIARATVPLPAPEGPSMAITRPYIRLQKCSHHRTEGNVNALYSLLRLPFYNCESP